MPRDVPDLTHRVDPALLPELMDEPCSYEDFRGCVHDLAHLNRILLAYRPTLQFLGQALKADPNAPPINVLDVGSGAGDTLRRIASWAHRYHHALQLTGIDLNPHATRAATEFTPQASRYNNLHFLTGDVFTHPATQTPDLVLSSLVTHHMRDAEIIQFLRWMETHATAGWFISDLLRSPRSFRLFGPLARFMRWHPFVQHDGLVSIRRAFCEPDWRGLLAAAEIPATAVRLHRTGIGRLCLTRLRQSHAGNASPRISAPSPP